MKPKKWVDVYPHGTKEGDEEFKFFNSLGRNKKFHWRSASGIAKETGLDPERVEEIIQKYYKKGMVFQNPKNDDQWGYWERVPQMLPEEHKSISKKDQDDRIKKSLDKSFSCIDLRFSKTNVGNDRYKDYERLGLIKSERLAQSQKAFYKALDDFKIKKA